MRELPLIENAFLCIKNDLISDFGEMNSFIQKKNDKVIDVGGKLILPCWCDSHSHVVYAGDRSSEFVDRINGLSYQEIANRGGGILNSAKKLQNTTEEFREDTTNYLFNNKTLKKIESVKVPEEWTRSSESITVDTVEDMDKLKKIISQLPKTSPDNWGILQILGAMNKYEKTT